MNDWYTLLVGLANHPLVALPIIITVLPVELWMLYKLFKGEPE